MKDALAVSDGLNNSSKGHIRSRKKKSTPDNNVAVQKITVGSILVDNEAAATELWGIVSTDTGAGENGIRESFSLGEEVVAKKRRRASKSVGNVGAVRKRMRGSIPVDNEAVPTELRGIISTDIEAGTNRMMDLVPVVEGGVVKKRTRRTNSVGNEEAIRRSRSNTVGNKGVVRKKMRGSISVDNDAVSMELGGVISTDIDAETDGMMEPISVGEEGVAKKRGRRANSVGEEGTVKRKRRGSVSVESNGAVTRRKRASSR
jgi:transcription factor MYB, plant